MGITFREEKITSESAHSKKIFAVKFHPEDKHIFLTASWDHSVKVIKYKILMLTHPNHVKFVNSLVLQPLSFCNILCVHTVSFLCVFPSIMMDYSLEIHR